MHICDECIATCNEMMAQNAIEQVREDERLLTPQEIKARLDEYVIGQDEAKKILSEHEVSIIINVNEGDCTATCWGCDLTYDYVRINGDYRT